jgi:hypothetical protein
MSTRSACRKCKTAKSVAATRISRLSDTNCAAISEEFESACRAGALIHIHHIFLNTISPVHLQVQFLQFSTIIRTSKTCSCFEYWLIRTLTAASCFAYTHLLSPPSITVWRKTRMLLNSFVALWGCTCSIWIPLPKTWVQQPIGGYTPLHTTPIPSL